MREYSKVSPRLWTGTVGRSLRGDALAQAVASYLVTSPHANMAGLYHLPTPYAMADLGHGEDQIRRALEKLEDTGYCRYDDEHERVWVIEHLRHELTGKKGGELSPKDNRCKALASILEDHSVSPLAKALHDHYSLPFEAPSKPLAKPLRSQEQEQQQDKEQEEGSNGGDSNLRGDRLGHVYLLLCAVFEDEPDWEWLERVAEEDRYEELDLAWQLTDMADYWEEHPKGKDPTKTNLKRAVRTWLRKALEIAEERGRGSRTDPESANRDEREPKQIHGCLSAQCWRDFDSREEMLDHLQEEHPEIVERYGEELGLGSEEVEA